MRAHNINRLNNFICGWYMDDDTLCDDIIEYHKTAKTKFQGETTNGLDLAVKESIDAPFSLAPTSLTDRYNLALNSVVEKYIEKYPYCMNGMPWSVMQSPAVQWYPPGGGYKVWHSERISCREPQTSRHLVFMTYLNDVEDSGETEWFHQNLKVKPEKGLTVIWGSDWTFTHRGIPSPTQEKYIITGWFNYIEPNFK